MVVLGGVRDIRDASAGLEPEPQEPESGRQAGEVEVWASGCRAGFVDWRGISGAGLRTEDGASLGSRQFSRACSPVQCLKVLPFLYNKA